MHYLYDYLWESPTEFGVRNLLRRNHLTYYTDEIIKNCNKTDPGDVYGVRYLDDQEEAESLAAISKSTTDLKEEDVFYNIDRFGLRHTGTNILEDQVDTLVFGCSFTYGIGIPLEKTWTYSTNTRIPENRYINLAVPGSSISKITRLLYSIAEYKKPKRIIILLPDYNREEIITEKDSNASRKVRNNFETINFVPRYLPENQEVLYYIKRYMNTLTTENNKVGTYKNLQIIKLLTTQLNIDLYITSWCPWTYSTLEKVFDSSQIAPYFEFKNDDKDILYARDGGHPGLKDNQEFADKLLKFISDKENLNLNVL